MEANETHISLETARLLKGCGLESRYWYRFTRYPMEITDDITFEKITKFKKLFASFYPAYTRQEILWEYLEEFFGRMSVCDYNLGANFAFMRHAQIILEYLQQKKYQMADEYFRENSVLLSKKD